MTTKTEQIIDKIAHGYIEDHEEEVISELRRLDALNAACLREVAQWRMREEARQHVDARPYPWPALDLAIAATDAARRDAGEATT